MSHFAEIDAGGMVLQVIVAEQDYIDSGALGPSENWVKTSFNVSGGIYYDPETGEAPENQDEYINDDYPERKRKNFAARGGYYLADEDMFIGRKPGSWNEAKQRFDEFPSWEVNSETGIWEPPVSRPASIDAEKYVWNEEDQQWDLVEE